MKTKYFKFVPLGIVVLFIAFLVFHSCTFDNEEDLLKESICDTTNLVYNDLTYIFSDICANCHSETLTYRSEIKMDTYQNVKSSINTGLVIPAINHADGAIPMPNGLPKLSDCDILKIETWVESGMPEN